jgi:hypothetical protein
MYCVYEWDEHRDLVTLTAADGYGLRWTQVMTWEQWETVADRAMEPGFGGPGPTMLEDLRALVASVIGPVVRRRAPPVAASRVRVHRGRPRVRVPVGRRRADRSGAKLLR